MDIYTVSYATVDLDNPENCGSGAFMDIFSTKAKAVKAIKDDIETIAQDHLDLYDKKDWKSEFGVKSAKELAKKMLVRKTVDGMYFFYEDPVNAVSTEYTVTKYSTDYIK